MNRLIYIFILLLIAFIACDDFFDEDLTDKTIELIGPADGLKTSNTSFIFWWNEVDGASKYNLQIVSPTFEQVEKLVLDTNLTGTQYEYQLYPGNFQWRVKGYNGSSETEYVVYTLTVDSTLDLTGQDLVLSSPSENYATNESSVDFSWQEKPNADYYTFKLVSGDWSTGSIEVIETPIYNLSWSQTLGELSEGEYSWGVRAENNISSSNYGFRSLIIDTTSPDQPNLSSPSQGEEVESGNIISFSWTRPNETGSNITDSLYVSTDSTFVASHEIAIERTETSYSKTFEVGSTQKYYWRVRSIDAAGNKSDYSVTRRFTVLK